MLEIEYPKADPATVASIILGGGSRTRLFPLSSRRAKPAVMCDKNLEDGDIEPAPKLIQVLFQNCRGQVDHWVGPYLRLTVERLRCTEKPYLKCPLMEMVADALYYNASLTLNILQKLNVGMLP